MYNTHFTYKPGSGTLHAQYTPGGVMCTMVFLNPSACAGGACPLRRWALVPESIKSKKNVSLDPTRPCISTSNKNKKIHVRIHLTVTVVRFSQCGRYWKVHNEYHQHVQQRQLSRTVASVADHVTRVRTPPVFKAVAVVAVGKRASAINAAIGVVVVRAVCRVIPLFKRAESARGSCT